MPKSYKLVRYELCTIGKLVMRGNRIIIPRCLRPRVLQLAHEGHQGIVKSKQRLRTKVWWPGADAEMEELCRSCPECQLVSRATPPEPMSSTIMPDAPRQHLAADLLGPLPTGHYVFVIVDYYSRYYEADIVKSITSKDMIHSCENIFARFGIPQTIRTDNGRQFVSEEFKVYLKSCGIKHIRTTLCTLASGITLGPFVAKEDMNL